MPTSPLLSRLQGLAQITALALPLVWSSPTHAVEDLANGWSPSPVELAQLPPFCRAQLGKSSQPGQKTPVQMCGVYMNHLCPGAVLVNRAGQASIPREERKRIAKNARGDIDYTKTRIQPGCALQPYLNTVDERLRILEMVLK
ncbi:hypothetical protein [Rubrivivax gelatinosus]|uniref:Uncharacterized protein n=1 Tax=Rubrivivax gelatinosus (strain NBRC 100245 / IL144) TaxID=983917 RepID=I0HL96_RUBGI|nr:hypothetical protein [Rubrivivax gelatinosus]BAL93783.1 hypothetical protein RGE_04380 [Rubrivivax gelatinosus IL144]